MKKLIIIFIAVFVVASCSDNLEGLNENIKDPTSVSGESLFASAQKQLVDQMVTPNVNLNNTKLWVQYWQETTYTDESNYDQTTRPIPERHWRALYKDVLKDLNEAAIVIEATTYPIDGALKPNKLAVIEILQVYTYSVLVETFGNIPYSEALDANNLLPAYDNGQTVYEDLISRLSVAINNLNTSVGSFNGSQDLIYGGNSSKWKLFANSLKLRMGILMSDVNNTLARETVESAVSSGVFTSNGDNANYLYQSAAPNTNPIHTNLVLSGRHDYVAAVTIIDMMNSLDDPRRPLYFTDVDGEYVGGEIGSTANYSAHSHVSAQVEEATAFGVLLDYTEVEFLLAEAASRNFAVGGDAKSHYDAGVVSSFEKWGETAATATGYLAQSNVDFDTVLANSSASEPWKEVVGNQKWLALYTRGFTAWSSKRLLDFPVLATPAEPFSGFPTRYTYPTVEQTLNGDNWTSASSAIGGDLPETKLFWDVN